MHLKKISVLILLMFLFAPMISQGAEKTDGNKYELITSQDGQGIFLLDTATGATWMLEILGKGTGTHIVNGWVPIVIKTEEKAGADKTKAFWVYSAEDATFMRSRISGKDGIPGISQ